MSLWEVWEIESLSPLRIKRLARIRADHQPAAMMKAAERWPQLAERNRVTVRPVKWLNRFRKP
jgi:hypothetical protein